MKIHMVLGISLLVLMLGCSSEESAGANSTAEGQSEEAASCEDDFNIEESCYLRYITLEDDKKQCCDVWLQTQRGE